MPFFRLTTSLPFAAAITFGLFIAMAALIAQDPKVVDPTDPPALNILARIVDTPPHQPGRKPTKLTEAPPPPATKWEKSRDGDGALEFDGPDRIELGPMEYGRAGAASPLIRIAPQYPEACRSRGAEGRVLVQFDVTERGEVVNVRVISSDNRCFDRTVVKTIMDWKYPPEARKGVVESFVFTLTE